MLTLRLPRLFAFSLRVPAFPFPFRPDAMPLLKLIRRAPAPPAERTKIVRTPRQNPARGRYALRVQGGVEVGLRRKLFLERDF